MSVCEWLGDLFSLNRDVECLIEMERCSMKKSLAFKRLVLFGASVLGLGAVNVLSVAAQDDSSESSSEVVSSESSDEEVAAFLAAEGSDLQLAMVAAIEAFQAELPDVEIVELDIELQKDGSFEIQLDGQDADSEHELKFDSEKNEVVSREEDQLDDDDVKTPLDFEQLLSIDEITEIALAEAGFGEVTDWNLEFDRRYERFEWELEIYDADTKEEAELTIEGLTGEVLKAELDD